MSHRIYDCFCYFNEDLLLELRLETLWNYVDYFVIVESKYTFSGKPKALNFKSGLFAKYLNKIRYLIAEENPDGLMDAWSNERFQRNYIAQGILDAKPEDWIIISDLDEIPRPETIAQFKPNRYKRGDFAQYAYAYYLNNRCTVDGIAILQCGSKITTYKQYLGFFSCAENVRTYKSHGLLRQIKRNWFRRFQVQIIQNGGWHFSWLDGIDKIILKIESYAHQEYNLTEYKNPTTLQAKIAAGEDILNPKSRCERQVIDKQFPEVLVKNPVQYAAWLL